LAGTLVLDDEDADTHQVSTWSASDIAKALGYRDAANMTRNIDDEDQSTRQVGTSSNDGGLQHVRRMNTINESGLYTAIFKSKLKAGTIDCRWVL
jgi:anti-repressor protein